MVLQVWEWWFLKFDLPLRDYGTSHTALCTMAKMMATPNPPSSTLLSPPQLLFHPFMDPTSMQAMLEGMFNAQEERLVCL